MNTLTISTLDDFTLNVLRQLAESEGKTLDQMASDLIREQLARRRDTETLLERAKAISDMTPKNVEQTDSVEIIRQMREERDRALNGE